MFVYVVLIDCSIKIVFYCCCDLCKVVFWSGVNVFGFRFNFNFIVIEYDFFKSFFVGYDLVFFYDLFGVFGVNMFYFNFICENVDWWYFICWIDGDCEWCFKVDGFDIGCYDGEIMSCFRYVNDECFVM